MSTIWSVLLVSLGWAYLLGIVIASVVLSYQKPAADWFDVFLVGVMSVSWPLVVLCLLVGWSGQWLGLHVIDPIIARLERGRVPEGTGETK